MAQAERVTEISQRAGYACGSFMAMGSPCELLIDSSDPSVVESLLDVVATEAWRIENRFSRYLRGNIIDKINGSMGRPVEIDDETASLLDFADMLTELSDGAFDITSGALREVWKFDGSGNVPDEHAVESVLKRVGWDKVRWQTPFLTMQDGMQIDLGGIGKEYAVDRAASKIAVHSDTACLVNFGGDIFATGAPSKSDGWQVGIESLNTAARAKTKSIRLKNGALATSGDARRFLLKDGIRYSHILNPVTGWPIKDAPRSITVAADTCTQAGMLATLAMLKGKKAASFLEQQAVQYWCYY